MPGDGSDAAAAVTGVYAPESGPVLRTGDGLAGGRDDEADGGAGAGREGDAGDGAAYAGGRPGAACCAGPDDRLIRVLTEATTAANATTPASTVMDVRKLTSSMRAYMTWRKVSSLASRDGPPGRVRVRGR